MYKKIVVYIAPCMLLSCYQKEQNCKDFKTGTFRFETTINGKKAVTDFVRNDSIEIETYNGKTDTATVRWVSDCEYILQKKHPKNLSEEKAIDIKILSTDKNTYTFEYGIVGANKKERGFVTKLK
ncbi:DNA topoisomerase IV [Flavobacterium branchiophilum]|uniref:DNA topoisomerase IV n=2 Tax=Flavobacterium branchiophilum TaxID=55197 RepID=A0A2H3KJA2_9FLAO|nr:hypothetical protein [Flavobacterium branchiophilum]OXA76360.1 DNA topoisomerase IV [Flavobacterium branchiophilum] [Flavobacterium branchiophilum NBRC 15030 = ATCC 35035]PDS22195.1 DNA topoisomerase IV [Flavobacterium branchiophilum]TQM39821.1 hypothetical protein BC670_0653 [Flavobacterium branchiophilum]CCB68947.1 Probable lipoprotein precursor [Flavobacterium branchiophilum FL-15]GEM55282.1 hypothetical protein FB1_15030 [Flavobacterium branchiophilum NBRC 15030 = ATCC 35035]